MTTRRFYYAAADRYAAGIDAECEACRWPCPEHGVARCRLCHTHLGECGYGGCTAPERLLAVDYWQETGTVAQRRALCAKHMRWWRHACLDGVERTIQSQDLATTHALVVIAPVAGVAETGETLAGTRLVLRRLREEAVYAALCVEALTASLQDAGLDAATDGDVTHVGDAVERMVSGAARALGGLDARHSGMEEAVAATPHPAKTSFYRRGR